MGGECRPGRRRSPPATVDDANSMSVTIDTLPPDSRKPLMSTTDAPPQAFVYDAIRTPRGRGKKTGSLYEVKPVDLVVGLLDEIKDRNPGFDPARVDVVVLG